MAQYLHNFYGTSYYGSTNAYSGIFETHEILTEEKLNNTFTFNIEVALPKATYNYSQAEIQKNPTQWTTQVSDASGAIYIGSHATGTELSFSGACDGFSLHYLVAPTGSPDVQVEVKTIRPDESVTTQTWNISMYGAQHLDRVQHFDNLPYGQQEIRIRPGAGHIQGRHLYFKELQVNATHITIEARAKTGTGEWTPYTKVDYTKSNISGSIMKLVGTSPSYAGKDCIQLRLHLASSDNKISPIVRSIETVAGDTNNRSEDGYWMADIDMHAVASAEGKTFKKIQSVDWTDDIPRGTHITYRSRSSQNKTSWTALTIPYRKDTKRLRLKEGRQNGYVTSALINPASRNPNLQISQWMRWDDIVHVPLDDVSTGITYFFLDEKDREITRINEVWKTQSKLLHTRLPKTPFKLRIQFHRRFDKSSPGVDEIVFNTELRFSQDKVMLNDTISAVDNFNTGEKMVCDMNAVTYNMPPELNKNMLEYRLIDNTVRPSGLGTNDIYLYYASEKDKSSRSNLTLSPTDKVWAVCRGRDVDQSGGALRHYQYSGGISYLNTPQTTEMASSFTPSLVGKEYRYYVLPGWPTVFHRAKETETLYSIALYHGVSIEDILALPRNQFLIEQDDIKGSKQSVYNEDETIKAGYQVEIPNNTSNPNVRIYWDSEKNTAQNNRTSLTEISSHNSERRQQPSKINDSVVGEVLQGQGKGEVDWVSDERIYEGIINLNNIAKSYDRVHKIPESGTDMEHEHIVQLGETYESIANLYDVYEEDIRWKNGANEARATDSPTPGALLIIPAKVVLPVVPAGVKISETPYEVQIVYNSVKLGDETLDTNLINKISLVIDYAEAERSRVPVRRGLQPNTSDTLPDSNVTQVIGIYDILTENIAASNYQHNLDYTVVNSSIDWSLAGAMSREPAPGNEYYVSYKYRKPISVRVIIDSDYQVQGGGDRLWRSSQIKEYSGVCEPNKDFLKELPPVTEWPDYNTENVQDLDYIIEDNDLWVKTWIEERNGKSFVRGSLLGRKPKDWWAPYIHTGFYYLGKKEFYLYSEEKREAFSEEDLPISENIRYEEGMFSNAAKFQRESENLIKNSGFQIADVKSTIFKTIF